MDADMTGLMHRRVSKQVIGAFFDTYNELGHGFLESVYEQALAIRLHECGLRAERQVPVEVRFHNHLVGEFRTDVLVEGCLLVEIKAARSLTDAHEAQLLNYLKATRIRVGLLLNFGPRPEFRRRVFS
ncbi:MULTISPECIES: GxxExxY protein [unclassified Luteimonas]|uniref:GxxExxY protein n=1 Tax=unclassified Luteimonas TaxID=2629088 RepID=UPI0018F097C8|nr:MULTISPECIES: GxxExxY protein [unclassified Luteimonas]MBJ6980941.1 GxxExxY protein [Luteimonas sp. MC1572]MBJ7573791.1 GxxExxY protein [Luteimonas sp. MC1828]QQO02296.1 GxxExxY protein [Luteimonas sp. MC1572]